MIPKWAIEKAISGGWKISLPQGVEAMSISGKKTTEVFGMVMWEKLALDPTFWQALVKGVRPQNQTRALWLAKADQFVYLILTDGDTDAFWNELLGNEKV